MAFILGLLCGIGAALAMRGVLLALWPRAAKKPRRTPAAVPPRGWEHTRNFLYYDGTVMPTEEDNNE